MITSFIISLVCLAFQGQRGGVGQVFAFQKLETEHYYKGSCPIVKGPLKNTGDKVDVQRLKGIWKNLYIHGSKTQGGDCHTAKMDQETKPGLNETMIQFLTGYRLPQEAGQFAEHLRDKFVYNDQNFLIFNHAEKPHIAANVPYHQLKDPYNHVILDKLVNGGNISMEELQSVMKYQEYQRSLEDEKYLDEMKEVLIQRLTNYTPYEMNEQVLDTDYENFLIMYNCDEHEYLVNSKGQDRDQVEYKKMTNKWSNIEEEQDENYNVDLRKHYINANIFVRSFNPDKLTRKKTDSYIKMLHDYLPDSDFGEYQIIKHKYYCPDETVDVFQGKKALNLMELYHQIQEQNEKKFEDYDKKLVEERNQAEYEKMMAEDEKKKAEYEKMMAEEKNKAQNQDDKSEGKNSNQTSNQKNMTEEDL